MTALVIMLTDEQQEQLIPILGRIEDGGACFAQMYYDGMRVRVFDSDTAKRVQDAIGATACDELHNSAVGAHAAARVQEGQAARAAARLKRIARISVRTYPDIAEKVARNGTEWLEALIRKAKDAPSI